MTRLSGASLSIDVQRPVYVSERGYGCRFREPRSARSSCPFAPDVPLWRAARRQVVGTRGACSESSDPRIGFPSDAPAHPGEAVGLRHSLPPSCQCRIDGVSPFDDSQQLNGHRLGRDLASAGWLRHDVQLAGVGDPRNLVSQAILGPLPTELNLVRRSPSRILIVELLDIHAHPPLQSAVTSGCGIRAHVSSISNNPRTRYRQQRGRACSTFQRLGACVVTVDGVHCEVV
jgi:hypothetical protein